MIDFIQISKLNYLKYCLQIPGSLTKSKFQLDYFELMQQTVPLDYLCRTLILFSTA